MKIIKGFKAAGPRLARRPGAEFTADTPALRQRIKALLGKEASAEELVREIVDNVRRDGDKALLDYTRRLDGVSLSALEVDRKQLAGAYDKVDKALLSALKLAARRIRSFHMAQGRRVRRSAAPGQLVRPLGRVGVYAPGGTAAYPSTVLMTAIPARVAGVSEVVLVTPPQADGAVPPATLVAADVAGVDRVFAVGGAQAIAALAFGTGAVPCVDKICGPGNIFVVLAKKLVYGAVDIDGLHGPSEVLIVADDTADPEFCAADLLAQAEHDPLASAVLVTTSLGLAEAVARALKRQLPGLARQAIALQSLQERGIIAVVDNMDEAIELANLYAAEHLYLMVRDADACVERIANAGCICLGRNATVAISDYVFGPSHVLPTGGTARFTSPLSVLDFVKLINVVAVSDELLRGKIGRAAVTLARAEGLEAHARAVERRLGNIDKT